MAAPTPGNMASCDPKCKCPGGPYANQAYLCSDPCAGQGNSCTFDCQNGCDCELEFPIGAVYGRLIGGNMSWGEDSTNCSLPGDWGLLHPAAFFNPQGQLVQYRYTFSSAVGCVASSVEFDECNDWGPYPTSTTIKKINKCTGGGRLLISGLVSIYIDGEFSSEGPNNNLWLNTSCVDGSSSTYCDDVKYPIGTEWVAEVEYKECDGQGNCGPLLVG